MQVLHQNMILTTLSKPENLAKLWLFIDCSRNFIDYANTICGEFNFIGPTGKLQISSCCAAIRKLEEKNIINLPNKWSIKNRNLEPKTSDSPIFLPNPPDSLSNLEKDIILNKVETSEDRIIFNTLMKDEGNYNFNKLPPMPLIYLAKTPAGVIGAIAFTSANINNAARDSKIGWNNEEKIVIFTM